MPTTITKLALTSGLAVSAVAAALIAPFLSPDIAAGPPTEPAPQPQATAPMPALPTPKAMTAESSGVTLTTQVDRSRLVAGEHNQVYVKVTVKADERQGQERRATQLFTVLDTSGSMCGQKMATAKSAVRKLQQVKSDDDRLNLITFSTLAESLVSFETTTANTLAYDKVQGIRCGGGTNMVAGLQETLRHVEDRMLTANQACRVLLLSDGHPGSVQGLDQQARRFAAANCPLTTIGIGDGYNENLLQKLADLGTGHFYWAGHDGGLDAIATAELNAGQQTAATMVSLRMNLPAGSAVTNAAGMPIHNNTVQLGSLAAGQERSFWMQLDVLADDQDHFDLGQATLSWTDDQTQARIVNRLPSLTLVPNEQQMLASIDPDLFADATLSERFHALNSAVAADMQSGNVADAERKISAYQQTIASTNAIVQNHEVDANLSEVSKLMKQVKQVAAQPKQQQNLWSKGLSSTSRAARRKGSH